MDALTSSRPLRILQISDSHLFEQRGETLLNVDTDASFCGVIDYIRAHEKKADVIVSTGDIAQDGKPGAYQRFLELALPLGGVLRGLPGNHDDNDTLYQVLKDHAQAITDIGQWRLVMLDSSIAGSSAGHIAEDQFEVLRQAINTANGRHLLVGVHHNPVPTGSRWLDGMMIDNGHKLLAVLQQSPSVKGLIWGHVHQEFDTVHNFGTLPAHAANTPDTINTGMAQNTAASPPEHHHLRLLAAPATCVQFTPRSTTFSLDMVDPGYRWLDLHDDGRIDTGVVRVSGLGIAPDTASKGY